MMYAEILKAASEARRFIAAAEKLKQASYNGTKLLHAVSGKGSGAARRASLDLTRQLAVMRKS